MTYHLSLSPNAETDLLESALWYENQQTGLGEKFTQKVESYFVRIQNNPLHFPLKKGNLREAYIQKFPYVIIYKIIEDNIIVFAVFNTHQNPQKKP
ncbi:type II toxin-antitoxin system RelE/ParE family toxin [Chryseobacterium sp.]|uniref:type II toxin-antitoxin system RelE/ParE family toxin n=1 Tax=Chryseobacterium sp. TaxID=1871047 RepID=UPI00289FF4F3|nr:type II toxin-antitoxin system RelE/ParE family toxin [Chryseobacterium sp.]